MTDLAVSRSLAIPRETIRDWRRGARQRRLSTGGDCPICGVAPLDGYQYAYLLGLYLGDGCLSEHRREVFRLRISLDARQPGIADECTRSMSAVVRGRRVGRQLAPGCIIVGSYWKHWPCLFPQHGPGRKHERWIELKPWQLRVTQAHSGRFLRGLIHSDGCRVENRVRGRIYPRYHFSNRSNDILEIFCQACDDFGVSWTRPSFKEISIARARDVRHLDAVVGPKG
jgi:hypothetical protein